MNTLLKIGSAAALAALAGVALIKFLKSEKGAEFIEHFQDEFNSVVEDFKEKAIQVEDQLADLLKHKTNSSTQA